VSHDQGQSWTKSIDVGAPFGIQNIAFPAVVAGDDNRAAFAFLDSATPGAGDSNTPSAFGGFWHLYVARTFDGGATWTTADLTPNDPVQRGPICSQGTTCTVGGSNTRNLLDFIDATVDAQGRLLVGYDDGCIAGCDQGGDAGTQPNSYSDLAVIARQSGGRPLFSANDAGLTGQTLPGRPLLNATRFSATPNVVNLTWQAPDNGGSPITGYKIYRSTTPGGEGATPIGASTTPGYTDTTATPNTTYYYQIVATNAVGDGPLSNEVSPTLVQTPNPCVLPGAAVATNAPRHQTGAPLNPDLNILSVSVAEPSSLPNLTATSPVTNFLVFTMKLADLSNGTGATGAPVLTPNHSWRFLFYPSGTNGFYAGMNATSPTTAQFVFGSLSTVGVASNSPGLPQTPISGSYSLADNTITVVVATKDVGDPQPGSSLGAQGRSYASLSSTAALLQASTVDFTPIGNYNVVGNSSCSGNSGSGNGQNTPAPATNTAMPSAATSTATRVPPTNAPATSTSTPPPLPPVSTSATTPPPSAMTSTSAPPPPPPPPPASTPAPAATTGSSSGAPPAATSTPGATGSGPSVGAAAPSATPSSGSTGSGPGAAAPSATRAPAAAAPAAAAPAAAAPAAAAPAAAAPAAAAPVRPDLARRRALVRPDTARPDTARPRTPRADPTSW